MSSYNLGDLKQEYEAYKKEKEISNNQIRLIESIYKSYVKNNTDDDPESLLTLISNVLARPINQLSELTYLETITIVDHFNKYLLPLSEKRRNNINEKLDLDKLSKILQRPINRLEDLTRNDYYLISNNPKYNFSYCLSHFNLLKRDQVINQSIDYEYGYQVSELCRDNKMYYLKFYDFLTLDYDGITLEEIKVILASQFKNLDKVKFYIYQTYNGYHLYYMSQPLNHLDKSTCYLMKRLQCDLWYILFSHKNGFKIRLSKKIDRDETYVERFLEEWGSGPVDKQCQEWIGVLNRYLV